MVIFENIDIDIDKKSLENIDISIDIDKAIRKNIDIDIEKENLVNIDIDIDKEVLENIDIDIDKEILENINIDKISNRLEFGISNSPTGVATDEIFPKKFAEISSWKKGGSLPSLLTDENQKSF